MDLGELLAKENATVIDDAWIDAMNKRMAATEDEQKKDRQCKEADPKRFLHYQYTV